MKTLSRLVAPVFALSLLVGAEPRPTLCPMADAIAAACKMPCCKKTAPTKAADCPMLREANEATAIAPVKIQSEFVITLAPAFQAVVVSELPVEPFDLAQIMPRQDPCSTPQSIPAPPVLA